MDGSPRVSHVSFATCVHAELIKMRRAPIWLAFVLLPGLSALLGSANYSLNLEVLTPGWENLWTQQTLFVCYFFLPALVGVAASHLWRLEHQGSNWNELMVAPVPARHVFCTKLVVVGVCMLVAFASIVAAYVACGVALGVPGSFPVGSTLLYVALGWLGSLAIAALQLVVSMLVRSFAAPVGMALAGGVAGLMATIAGAGYVFPYSLMQMGMNSNAMVSLSASNVATIVVMSVVWTAAAVAFAILRLRLHDIHAS